MFVYAMVISSTVFVCFGSFILPPTNSAAMSLSSVHVKSGGPSASQDETLVSYSYSFAVVAAFSELSASDNYTR
jgi:hypothetical protein